MMRQIRRVRKTSLHCLTLAQAPNSCGCTSGAWDHSKQQLANIARATRANLSGRSQHGSGHGQTRTLRAHGLGDERRQSRTS